MLLSLVSVPPLISRGVLEDGCYKALPRGPLCQLCTLATQGVLTIQQKTPTAEAGPPKVDQAWVGVLWLVPPTTPDGVTPPHPEPVARPLGSVGQLFDDLPVSLSPDSTLPQELCHCAGPPPPGAPFLPASASAARLAYCCDFRSNASSLAPSQGTVSSMMYTSCQELDQRMKSGRRVVVASSGWGEDEPLISVDSHLPISGCVQWACQWLSLHFLVAERLGVDGYINRIYRCYQ